MNNFTVLCALVHSKVGETFEILGPQGMILVLFQARKQHYNSVLFYILYQPCAYCARMSQSNEAIAIAYISSGCDHVITHCTLDFA